MSHSRLAPSSAHRWVACPGSVRMCEQMPAEPQSASAAEGEASHWVGGEVLSGRGGDPFTGRTAPNGVVITDEMVDGAKVYVAAVRRVAEPGTAVAVEQRIDIKPVSPECFGTADSYWWESAKVLHIWDYKYGFGIVEPFENWQLICYVAGLLAAKTGLEDQEITVNMHIVQPRPFHFDGPVRSWAVNGATLRNFINRLTLAAAQALQANPPITSGSHCKYCSARHACPAAQKVAMFAIDYTETARVEGLSALALAIEYRTILRARDAIEYRLTGLEAQARSRLQLGESIPGWALQQGAGRQQWSMPADQLFAVGDMMGVDLRRTPDAITPTQAKKAGLTDELVAAYTQRLPGEAKLVPTTDTLAARVFQQREG